MTRRLAAAALALLCGPLAGWLAGHHPLSGPVALGACLLIAALAWRAPARWVWLLLPLLPAIGLAPWTGWIVVEETDLAVLSIATGAYLRLALRPPAPGRVALPGAGLMVWALLALLAVSTGVSMQRGIADAGGLQWGWWQGYREPLNSVRLAKPIAEVLLLLPLWRHACKADLARAHADLRLAMTTALAVVALGVVWERLAFTGLLDFSSDYRSTGLFWEMHVGGAALDAMLALTLPFAVSTLVKARGALRWGMAAAVLALGLYAALVTFSRIVYLALPLGLLVWALLRGLQTPRADRSTVGAGAALVLTVTAAAAWLFPVAGYRGLLSLLGAVVLLLPLPMLRPALPSGRRLWVVWGAGAALGLTLLSSASWLDKGAYWAYAATWTAGALGLAMAWRCRSRHGSALAVACSLAIAGAVAAVCWHWGEAAAFRPAAAVAGVLFLTASVLSLTRVPAWPPSWRWNGQVTLVMAGAMSVVGVFGGGAYMGDRLSSVASDGDLRTRHWQHSIDLLRLPEHRWLGVGLGRFPAQQATSGLAQFRTGDFRLEPRGEGQALVLTSGSHDMGWGELFRISQRLPAPEPGPLQLRLKARTDRPAALHAELCEKHLLYNGTCFLGKAGIKSGDWQEVSLSLRGSPLGSDAWYAPRLVAFSLALESREARVEIDDISLTGIDGVELLANGDFEQGLARWFYSSDRHHMPWHAKNLAVHLYFEQGLFGLAAFAIATLAALARGVLGAVRGVDAAPEFAAALVGALCVGLVDSLLDMPRVALSLLLVLALMLALPLPRKAAPLVRR